MNILSSAINEIKLFVRDKRNWVFKLAFPMVLILVLGSALSTSFNENSTINKIKIGYTVEANNNVKNYLNKVGKYNKNKEFKIEEIKDKSTALDQIKDKKFNSYLKIKGNKITLYKNNRYVDEADISEGIVKSVVNNYNLISNVVSIGEYNSSISILSKQYKDNYIKDRALIKTKEPGAMDYYSMSILLLVGMYSLFDAVWLFPKDVFFRVSKRFAVSPIKKFEIFVGKILGVSIVSYISTLVIYLFCRYILNVGYGSHFVILNLILITEVLLFVSLGIFIGYIFKSAEASSSIVQFGTQVMAFCGGAYFKSNLGDIGKLLPFNWNLNALVGLVYSNNTIGAINSISLNIVVSMILILISVFLFRKREVV